MGTSCRETTKIPPHGPFESIEVSGVWLNVIPKSDVSLADLIDMSYFGELTPQMKFGDAMRLLGPPDNVFANEDHKACIDYLKDSARVELCVEDAASDDYFSPGDYSSTLRCFPYSATYKSMLSPSIVEHITSQVRAVLIKKPGFGYSENSVFVWFRGKRVDTVWWRRWR